MSAPLRIEQRPAAGAIILGLQGRLVADEGDRLFRESVADLVAAGSREFIVDLHEVTHMDSGGVGALVTAYLHVTRRGGHLKLLCPSERSCRVLRMTHLISVFEVYETEEQALQSIATPAAG